MSVVNNSDFVVLGAGNAGLAAAGMARAAGQSVVVVESRDIGGTCPLRGCVPKKVLVAAAEILHHIASAPRHHIRTDGVALDWEKLIERKRSFVDGVPQSFWGNLVARGIEVVRGAARFVDRQTILVDGQYYRGAKILIATGSRPRALPIPGFEHAVTSDHLLETTELPGSLVFIGGGVIALEFAHILARAGVKTTVLEAMPRILPSLDVDPVKQLVDATRRLGVEILTDVKVQAIVPRASGYEIKFEYYGATHLMSAEVVANGAGRVADVHALGLDAAGVQANDRGIVVDGYLRSVSNANVFAAGDTLATAQLSAVATYEGRIVGHNVSSESMLQPDYRSVPSVVFTVPALASVGLTEAQAKQLGLGFRVRINDMRDWRSARTYAENEAFSKVLVADDSDTILGAHLLGHGAAEIIHVFALAMKHGITASELAETVYAYPTFTSDIKFLV